LQRVRHAGKPPLSRWVPAATVATAAGVVGGQHTAAQHLLLPFPPCRDVFPAGHGRKRRRACGEKARMTSDHLTEPDDLLRDCMMFVSFT
jgi:hypothetical protein